MSGVAQHGTAGKPTHPKPRTIPRFFALTSIFIFCLGVRSPWRMTAMTQRSSSLCSIRGGPWLESRARSCRLSGEAVRLGCGGVGCQVVILVGGKDTQTRDRRTTNNTRQTGARGAAGGARAGDDGGRRHHRPAPPALAPLCFVVVDVVVVVMDLCVGLV